MKRFSLPGYPPLSAEKSDAVVAVCLERGDLLAGESFRWLRGVFHQVTNAPSFYREGDLRSSLRRMERQGLVEKLRKDDYPTAVLYRLTDEGIARFFCSECGEPKHDGCTGRPSR